MTPSQKRWFGAAALALAVPAGWAWIRLTSQRSENLSEFHGARLGMTASQLRRAFSLPGEFQVQSAGEADGELAVEWAPLESDATSSTVSFARFEFHQGLLVAVRADTQDPSQADLALTQPFLADAAAVLHRRVDGHSSDSNPRVRITLLSRDCPTHAEEVLTLTGLSAQQPDTSSEEPPSSL